MTSKLGRINEAVRRRIAQAYDQDEPCYPALHTWRGQSIIVMHIPRCEPQSWPTLNLRYGATGVYVAKASVRMPRPEAYAHVTAEGVLDWITTCVACAYMDEY